MSHADREEGLVPYMPTLGGVNHLTVISHKNAIGRPARVVTAPTTLESTSLVLAFGIDLFVSRVAPAKEFDRLNEDFNFVALVGARPPRYRRATAARPPRNRIATAAQPPRNRRATATQLPRVSPPRQLPCRGHQVTAPVRGRLSGATVFLIVATVGSGWYSDRKDLVRAWK